MNDREISAAERERIIRRAAELQFEREGRDDENDAIGREELLRIGREAGLEERHLRRAWEEVRSESFLPQLPEESALATRLWGRAVVRTSRRVPGGREEVERSIEIHLRDYERLKRVRRQPGLSLWEAAEGWVHTMSRNLDIGGRGYELATARSVSVRTEEIETGRTAVTVAADLRNLRGEHLAGWLLGMGIPALVIGAVLFLEVPFGVILGPLLVAAVLAAGVWATGRSFPRQLERMRMVLEGFLDRLERGETAGAGEPGWRDRAPPFF